jgi:hypothetical protein
MGEQFWTGKQIGVAFGVTSHVIGERLKEIRLRTADGKPSGAAFDGGFCAPHWASGGRKYCWAWEKTKALEALERNGWATDDENEGPYG